MAGDDIDGAEDNTDNDAESGDEGGASEADDPGTAGDQVSAAQEGQGPTAETSRWQVEPLVPLSSLTTKAPPTAEFFLRDQAESAC